MSNENSRKILANSKITLVARFIRDKKGSIALFTGVVLAFMIGMLGLGAEVGYQFVTKRKLQNIADASAYAAAVIVRDDGGAADATLAANDTADRIGRYPANAVLTVSAPTIGSGAFAGQEGAEVVINSSVPPLFSAIYRTGPIAISGRAVATVSPGSIACVLALDGAAAGAMTFTGTANANLVACDVHSNSLDANGLVLDGSAQVSTGCVASSGGLSASAGLNLSDCAKPITGAAQISDPYASLSEPAITGPCATPNVFDGPPSAVYNIAPARYCGMSIKRTVNMAPGVYVIDGGNFVVESTATLNGTGVTIYLVNGAQIQIAGGAQVNLSAPTSGPYVGILFFGSRSSAGVTHDIRGNSTSSFSGIIYTANDRIEYTGSSSSGSPCTLIVGRTVRIAGNASLGSNCTGSGITMPKTAKFVRVVE